MKLLTALRDFDGKHTQPLRDLADHLIADDTTLAELAAIAEHENSNMQVAATWILKQWVASGISLPAPTLKSLIGTLCIATHWLVRLHILQMLSSSTLLPNSKPLQRKLESLVHNDNKLVRAWAYSALAQLGNNHTKLRAHVLTIIGASDEDEAGSVRARVRQIRKKHPWTRKAE